jgi:peroxiredoxin
VGDKAPEFSLTDTQGKTHTLASHKGKIVVLEWTNPKCPVVVGLYKSSAIPNAYKTVLELDKDVVWMAINTTSGTTADENNAWIKQHDVKYPVLLDVDGSVGRQFGAARTPHMYVIDKDGVVRYMGAIDDNKAGDKSAEETTNYVVNAIKQIKAGETVSPDNVPAYGCTVKYGKPAKQE